MKTDYASMVRSILAKGATGRQIPGKPANSKVDDKLAPVQSGEYIVPTSAVNTIGRDNLDRMVMNALGSVKVPSGSMAKGFRRGGYVGGGRRGGPGYIPQSMINYQDAPSQNVLTPEQEKWFWSRGYNASGPGGNREALREGYEKPLGGFRDVGVITGHPFNVGWGTQPNPSWGSWFQGPTMLPTNWTYHPGDMMSYPRAIPVTTADTKDDVSNVYSRHTPPNLNT